MREPPHAAPTGHELFQLGDWTIDGAGNRLLRGDEVRPLRFKAMAVLLLLAERAGQTVSREELIERVWSGNAFVAPKAINTAIWTIRQALGDDSDTPRYLETIAKKGYRLIAPVKRLGAEAEALPVPAGRPHRRLSLPVLGAFLLLLLALLMWGIHRHQAPADHWPGRNITALTQYPGHEFLGALSPDGQQLAFAWWRGQGASELYVRSTVESATQPEAVGGAVGDITGLSWSPDGRAIVYAARATPNDCQLWVYQLASRQRQALTGCYPLFTPTVAWSPDGRQIAFTGAQDGQGGLFLIAPGGGPAKRLTQNLPGSLPDHQPAWSPDGRRLAFARSDGETGTRELHELELATGATRQLSRENLHFLHGLSYAPNGNDLIYATTQQDRRVLMLWERAHARVQPLGIEGSAPATALDGSLVYALLRAHVSIGYLPLDGLAQTPRRLIGSVGSDRGAAVHPDGRQIAFVSRRSGLAQLWWTDRSDPQAQTRLLLSGRAAAPAWSPNGQALAFLGPCGDKPGASLCVRNSDSGQLRALTQDRFNYGPPSWDPDSRKVWLSSDRGGRWQVWEFAADGSAARALPQAPTPAAGAHVASDGQRVFYSGPQPGELLVLELASGSFQRIRPGRPQADLVHWQLHPRGVLALTRSDKERFELWHWPRGDRQLLSEQALGTFPEMASFALDSQAQAVFVDLADTAYADLMVAR